MTRRNDRAAQLLRAVDELTHRHGEAFTGALLAAVVEALRQPHSDDEGPAMVSLRLRRDDAIALAEALARAQRGDPDPFKLKRRGRPPKYISAHAAAELFVHLKFARGLSGEEAIAETAQRCGASESTIRDLLKTRPELVEHYVGPRRARQAAGVKTHPKLATYYEEHPPQVGELLFWQEAPRKK